MIHFDPRGCDQIFSRICRKVLLISLFTMVGAMLHHAGEFGRYVLIRTKTGIADMLLSGLGTWLSSPTSTTARPLSWIRCAKVELSSCCNSCRDKLDFIKHKGRLVAWLLTRGFSFIACSL